MIWYVTEEDEVIESVALCEMPMPQEIRIVEVPKPRVDWGKWAAVASVLMCAAGIIITWFTWR